MHLIEGFKKEQMGKDSFFLQMASMFKVPQTLIDKSDRCEIWGSDFKDAGRDCTEYRFYNGDVVVGTHHVDGY